MMSHSPIASFRVWMLSSVMFALLSNWFLIDLAFAVAPQADQEPVDEMKVIDQLDQLQKQLESPDGNRRAEAEREIIELGPVVLDHLDPAPNASTDASLAIARIRKKLESIEIERFSQASKVTLQGKISVEDALNAISKQTANKISTDNIPKPILEKEIQVDFKNLEFWNALYEVTNQAGVKIDAYGGETATLQLIPDVERMEPDGQSKAIRETVPRCLAGMFDFAVARIIAERDFSKPKSNSTQLHVVARWEPRLQPISIEMPFEFITAIDENGDELKLLQDEGVFHALASAEFPETELTIPLELVDRRIKQIQTLEAVLIAVLPGRQETFRFNTISKLKEGVELRKGGAVVTFEGVQKNEDLFGVTLRLAFDESFNALESHRAWAYDNPMYLEDGKGNKIEPVTMEGLRQSETEVAIRYYFTEDPKDLKIVYKTVSAIIKRDVKLKLSKIDLP
jgi:hypothetical protein